MHLNAVKSDSASHPHDKTDAHGLNCPPERHSSQFGKVNWIAKVLVYSWVKSWLSNFQTAVQSKIHLKCTVCFPHWSGLVRCKLKKIKKNFRLLSLTTLMSPPNLIPLSLLDKIFQSLHQKHCTVLVAGVSPSKENPSCWTITFWRGELINYRE